MPPEENTQNAQSTPQVPPPGPPKKGFWGFIASIFPKRPEPLQPTSPTGDTKAQEQAAGLNPSDSQPQQSGPVVPEQGEATDTSVPQTATQPYQATSEEEADASASGKPIEGVQSISEVQVPQTDEEGGQNSQGENTPPTVAVPQSVKAPGLEENDGNPPTLPTEPPASGGSPDDPSTPDEDEKTVVAGDQNGRQ